jgi:hypothetical protein
MPDWNPNVLRERSVDSANSISGTVAVPLVNGPVIPDDMTMVVWKISGNNTGIPAIGLSVFAGDAAVPARRQAVQFTLDGGVPFSFPPNPNPNSPIRIVKPNTGVVPTQENGVYFGDGGAGGVITGISMSYYMMRKG